MSKKVVKIIGKVFGLEEKDKLDEEHYYLPAKQAQHLVNCKVAEFASGGIVSLSLTEPPKKQNPPKKGADKSTKKDEKDASKNRDVPDVPDKDDAGEEE